MTTKSTEKPAPTKLATKKKVSATTTTPKLTADSTVFAVKDSRTPTKESRQKIKRSVPAAGIRASDLMKKADCNLRTIAAMLKRGFLEVR